VYIPPYVAHPAVNQALAVQFGLLLLLRARQRYKRISAAVDSLIK